ncbi:hypothetical protein DFH08DRAFT_969154 [Mycena albidolilacea]|uniref:Uncharacterized protein n=1 Tax=Mycena albidolilacea TaxID=1033008 RepID=A0AAD7EHH0_9AGAR|nr:hypothetical protein DFH08DRAFT_969154 [Mycena albidolilacea]
MSAQPIRTPKPLLLPGIAPHLFQTRAPARLRPKMLVKDSPEGLVADHSRTPSDGSTVAPPTLEEVQAVALSFYLRTINHPIAVIILGLTVTAFILYAAMRASISAPLAFTCAPGSPPPSPDSDPDSSECPCLSDASHAPPSPTVSSFSATSSLSYSSRYSSSDPPYPFIPASTADPALNGEGVYEDANPAYSYHSANNYSSCAASPRVRRTGRGRRIPIAPLIRACAMELDVELRELSGEVEFAPTQFGGENEEQEEQEIDDSGIFLAEDFVPARSSTPPRRPHPLPPTHRMAPHRRRNAPQTSRAPPPPRRTPIAAAPSRHDRTARVRARPGVPAEPVVVVVGVGVCVCGGSGDAGGPELRALTPSFS